MNNLTKNLKKFDGKVDPILIADFHEYAERPKSKSQGLTPMMVQFLKIKEDHENDILFYRMGDFYEMFFEDAIIGSSYLEITLTKRGTWEGRNIPMCGIPFHSAENYLGKLIQNGFRVAICEQKQTNEIKTKGIPIHREVVRVITPGTITEEILLVESSNNFLCSWSEVGGEQSVSWIDLTTGQFFVEKIDLSLTNSLATTLERISPRELIMPEKLGINKPLIFKECISIQSDIIFDSKICEERIKQFFNLSNLDSLGYFDRSDISASGAILAYINLTQKGKKPLIKSLSKWTKNNILEIDIATRRSLELVKTQTGEKSGSLFHCINKTITAGGSRLLLERLNAPLINKNLIEERLDTVSKLLNFPNELNNLRGLLRVMPDIQRSLARLKLQRGGPRDLSSIRDSCLIANKIHSLLNIEQLRKHSGEIQNNFSKLKMDMSFYELLNKAIADNPPLMARDGNFIKQGFSQELDVFKSLRDKSKHHIISLQQKYALKTEVQSLKIKHNNLLGYHVEIRNLHEQKFLNDKFFIRRQSTAQSTRFTTIELAELEKELSSAAEKSLFLELELFNELNEKTLSKSEELLNIFSFISVLDVAASNATLSEEWNYSRPLITNERSLSIIGGRHAVVEQSLNFRSDSKFMGNDCHMDQDKNLWLITGPNMAGKSTFLRQNALICILAQMGSYVPADKAIIGISDRVFSRVGSGDDLSKGESTFMLEMIETATILNQATKNSFVILDEIGRGTATWDGLSLAWAIIEQIHNIIGCKTLFATHYHELTSLNDRLNRLELYTVDVREHKEEVIFLYKLIKGKADKSYGIQVAKLAGIPENILIRAKNILEILEEESSKMKGFQNSLPLFEKNMPNKENKRTHPVIDQLKTISPDQLTPLEALEIMYKLKSLL